MQGTDSYFFRLCHWTEKEHMKHVRADFPYFAAVWTTEAGRDEFRTVVDWCNWVRVDHPELASSVKLMLEYGDKVLTDLLYYTGFRL